MCSQSQSQSQSSSLSWILSGEEEEYLSSRSDSISSTKPYCTFPSKSRHGSCWAAARAH